MRNLHDIDLNARAISFDKLIQAIEKSNGLGMTHSDLDMLREYHARGIKTVYIPPLMYNYIMENELA